jgi:hypothetical protein
MLSPSSGQQLSARYTLRERLSSSASGETWRARDAARDRDVIVKFLPPALAEDSVLHGLRLELEAARSLDPRQVAAAETLEREGNLVYLLREYVPGRDLSTLRGESWRRIVTAAAQVADALATLHERAIVHRDVKPGNVVLRPDGSATLIDLGAAAYAGSEPANAALSRYNSSPQQLSGEPPAPADDIYGLGALLYELLSGYPPFYPNFSRERVLREPVAALKPAQPAPPELTDLVMRMLAKSPAERPADIVQVASALRNLEGTAVDASADGAATTPAPAVATIVRPIVRATTAGTRDTSSATDKRRRWLIGAGFAALVLIAAGVLLVLPRFAHRSEPSATNRAPSSAATERSPQAEAAVDLKLLAEQMQEAERVRDAYDALYPAMQKRSAEKWAAQAFAAAREQGEQARRHFAAREFIQARDAYSAGVDQLQKISDLVQPTLEEQLGQGNAALEAGQSTVAAAAFALALAIDPENAAATKGAKRAATLDAVNALVAQASNAERDGQLALAVQRYEEALKLDADARTASEGLTRVRERIAGDEFAAAMSQGLRELEAGKLAEARNAFERAGRLRPGSREVSDALARVSETGTQRSIASHRAQAERLEREDRWPEALAEYQAALKLDPKLEFALAGRERLAPRVELLKKIDGMLARQDRLMSAAVRDEARALVAEAQKLAASSPTLRARADTLAAKLGQYEMPVRVALVSNNQTQVVVYKVGQMGVFERREIELLPGTYTVVGTRTGFRDVRRELTVQPGQNAPTLDIRCEDPI